MGCAAASLTPPNVSAASLEGDALRPVPLLTVSSVNSSASNSTTLACRVDKDNKVTELHKRVCACARARIIRPFITLQPVLIFIFSSLNHS